MKGRLRGVRLDTPKSRGGVTPEIVIEINNRLENENLGYLQIIVSGGITPERIKGFTQAKAPVSGFVVGHYIAAGTPKTVAAHLKNIDGMNVGKLKSDLPNLRAKIGMVFQNFELFPHLNILDNMLLAQKKVLKRSVLESEEKATVSYTHLTLPTNREV